MNPSIYRGNDCRTHYYKGMIAEHITVRQIHNYALCEFSVCAHARAHTHTHTHTRVASMFVMRLSPLRAVYFIQKKQ